MLQPAARQIGDGLATVAKSVKIALAPLEAGIWGYEQIKEWLSIRVTRILADRKITEIEKPPLSIAGPLVFQLIFAKDEPELKEMYASLLASSMDSDKTSAHPSFVSIIQQLTPDEAKILKYFYNLNEEWPSLSVTSASEGTALDNIRNQFKEICEEKIDLIHHDKSDAYFDNLIRLRIFNLIKGNEAEYYPGDRSERSFEIFPSSVTTNENALFELSAFGQLFLDACIEKDLPDDDTSYESN